MREEPKAIFGMGQEVGTNSCYGMQKEPFFLIGREMYADQLTAVVVVRVI